jgi:hypothetical protein
MKSYILFLFATFPDLEELEFFCLEHFPQISVGGLKYVIESNGIYKIGCTQNVSQRIKNIQTSCPFPIKPLLVINGDETTEKDLHLQFQNKKTHGEWFVLNTKDVICISKKYSNEIEWMSAV